MSRTFRRIPQWRVYAPGLIIEDDYVVVDYSCDYEHGYRWWKRRNSSPLVTVRLKKGSRTHAREIHNYQRNRSAKYFKSLAHRRFRRSERQSLHRGTDCPRSLKEVSNVWDLD